MTKRLGLIVIAVIVGASGLIGCSSVKHGQGGAVYTCYYSDGTTATTTRVGDGTIGPECK